MMKIMVVAPYQRFADIFRDVFSTHVETPILPYDIIRCIIQTKELFGNRRIAFAWAAPDVFESEPSAADNPLFSLPNVIATPHTASFTHGAFNRIAEHMAQNIQNILSGGPPAWPVNNPTVGIAPAR